MAKFVCFGEMLLRIGTPGADPLLRTPALAGYVGGAEANVAVALASLGQQAAMLTTLPDHALGDACLRELRARGVDTSHVRRAPGRLGLYFLQSPGTLRASQVIYDRAGSAFAHADPADYAWEKALRGAEWLHVSGITPALGDAPVRALNDALNVAAANGVRVSFDCNFRPALWHGREAEARDVLAALARRADALFGGARDVALLFGDDFTSQPEHEAFASAADVAFEECPGLQFMASTLRRAIAIDHHELRACVADRVGVSTSRTFDLCPIVDRIGGGDAFAAGVLHAVAEGAGRDAIAEFGGAAGALKHGLPGDFSDLGVADVQRLVTTGGLDVQR